MVSRSWSDRFFFQTDNPNVYERIIGYDANALYQSSVESAESATPIFTLEGRNLVSVWGSGHRDPWATVDEVWTNAAVLIYQTDSRWGCATTYEGLLSPYLQKKRWREEAVGDVVSTKAVAVCNTIASQHLLKKATVNTIRVGNCDVSKVSVVRNLGAWFDDQLAVAVRFTKLCRAAFCHLHIIRRTRKYLSMDSAATRIHSFVSSRRDYCNSLLYGVPKHHIDNLQRVQSAAARLVVVLGKCCHITPVLHQLHWLPVSFRINFQILFLTFKAIHELAPPYINVLAKILKAFKLKI